MNTAEVEVRRSYLWVESLRYEPCGLPTPLIIRYGLDLVKEVDRLRAELATAKEEVWDEAIDYSSITEAEADAHKAENPYR